MKIFRKVSFCVTVKIPPLLCRGREYLSMKECFDMALNHLETWKI